MLSKHLESCCRCTCILSSEALVFTARLTEGNLGQTSEWPERWSWVHMAFPKHIDTILNWPGANWMEYVVSALYMVALWWVGLQWCVDGLCAGFRHPSPTTVSRTIRVLHHLMAITVKSTNRDKFEVTTETVAYLAGRRRKIYSQTKIKEWFDVSKHLE